MTAKQALADIAKEKAQTPLHGFVEGEGSNLGPILRLFPGWSLREADRLWCAAFVYYCCIEAGFKIPRRPQECTECNLAGCKSWEEYALGENGVLYFKEHTQLEPEPGDIVLYDNVFCEKEHDHIGVVLEVAEDCIIAAEGNIASTNRSGIIKRERDEHIRAYIRLPEELAE